MAISFFRYIKIFFIFVRTNYMRAMEYRLDFFSSILPTMVYTAGYLLFARVIVSKVPLIVGWNFDQMMMLFFIEQMFFYTGWIFYRHSLEDFSESVRLGTFDLLVRLPINTRFLVSFRRQSPDVVISLSVAIIVFTFYARNLVISFSGIVLFILFFICGVIILYNLMFAIAATSFWTTDSIELIGLADEITGFGRYPLQVFPNWAAFFLLVIIPAVLMVYVPATALMGILDWRLAVLSVVMVIVTWVLSQFIWHKGLRYYSSASS